MPKGQPQPASNFILAAGHAQASRHVHRLVRTRMRVLSAWLAVHGCVDRAQVKKLAVKVLAEKRPLDDIEQMMNNALALALNSKSSKCVQMVLDTTTMHKVRGASRLRAGAGGCV